MAKYARFRPGDGSAAQLQGGHAAGPSLAESDRFDQRLSEFKHWFASLDGFGEYLRTFFETYGGYFNCYSEEHALMYTHLHKEFVLNLEQAVDGWLKLSGMKEEDFGEMLRRAASRGDGEGDAAIGSLLGLLDYEPWIRSIFALQRYTLESGMATEAQAAEAALAAVITPPQAYDAAPEAAVDVAPATVLVTVPEGVEPGQQVQVTSPDGQLFVAIVPEGCFPGMCFSVAYSVVPVAPEELNAA